MYPTRVVRSHDRLYTHAYVLHVYLTRTLCVPVYILCIYLRTGSSRNFVGLNNGVDWVFFFLTYYIFTIKYSQFKTLSYYYKNV